MEIMKYFVHPDLSVKIGDIILNNPVTVASGTFGYGQEFSEIYDLNKLGAIFVKSITLKPRSGNPPQRIVETPSGMLNAIGLQNEGVDDFIKNKLPFLEKFTTPVFVNIAGSSSDEYVKLAKRLASVRAVDGIELNLSCPNVKEGCMIIGQDPARITEVTSRVKKAFKRTVVVKLSPNVTNIQETALAAQNGGADALSLINTLVGMEIDTKTRKPVLHNITGGLSGPAIRPVALRMVWEASQVVTIPIIGQGGIDTVESALNFLIAGASAISIGTANFYDPWIAPYVVEGIRIYMIQNRMKNLGNLIGSLKTETK